MAQAAPVLSNESAISDPILNDSTLEAPPPKRGGRPKGSYSSNRFGPTRDEEPDQQQSFWDYLTGLSSVDWEAHMLYVYMWDPIVDLTKGGRETKYRKRYTSAVNEESLKREIGSGTYQLKLNRLDQQTRREKTIKELVVNIFDPDFPPNLPPGGWLDDPRNKEWAWAKPILEKRWAVNNAPAQSNDGVPAYMVQFMNEVRSELNRRTDLNPSAKDQLMSSVVTILPQLLQQQNNANDPAKIIEALSRVKDIVAPPAPTPQDNTLLTFVMTQLTELQKSHNELIKAMLNQKQEATKAPDPLQQVKTMAELITTVSGIVQPAAPKEPWQTVVEDLGPKALDVAQNFVTSMAMRNAAMNRPAPPQARPAAVPVVTQPNPAAVPVPVQPEPVATHPVPENPAPDSPNSPGAAERPMLFQIAVLASNALNLGMEGDHFADQICYKFGTSAYDQFIATVPKDALLPKLQQVPEAWQLLQPFEALLPSFIDSFYAYAEQTSEDNPKNISEPAPEPVKPAKKKTKGSK